MTRAKAGEEGIELRGQTAEANSLREVVRETIKLWRRHHLSDDQTKHVVEDVRRELGLAASKERRRTVDRLDREEIERLIEADYRRASSYGLMVKTLFYTGARVSEFVNLRVTGLHLALDPPQVHIVHAKGGSDGYVQGPARSRPGVAHPSRRASHRRPVREQPA